MLREKVLLREYCQRWPADLIGWAVPIETARVSRQNQLCGEPLMNARTSEMGLCSSRWSRRIATFFWAENCRRVVMNIPFQENTNATY